MVKVKKCSKMLNSQENSIVIYFDSQDYFLLDLGSCHLPNVQDKRHLTNLKV